VFAVVLSLGFLSVSARLGGLSSIKAQDLKEWLSYLASDELEGRAVYSAGLGLAAAYIESHLRAWGVKPAGDRESYLQTVRVLGVKATSRATVTVQVGGETRTFKDREGVTFPSNAGGKRSFTVDHVEFAGYGIDAPGANHMDFRGRDVKGAAVVWLGANGPKGVDQQLHRRLLTGRTRYVTEQLQAVASIGPQAAPLAGAQGTPAGGSNAEGTGAGRGGEPIPSADFTTAQRLDRPVPPRITAADAFFDFLFSKAPTRYDELKRRADAREPLPPFRLDGVKITFNVDADYEVVRTQLTHNVVAIVEGSDPHLRSSYVAFGAHYDHVGYAEAEVAKDGNRRPPRSARVAPGAVEDRIWNGADDDGSGTVAVMALAKAFAFGPRPRRSLLFVWHAAEEIGLYGSRYFADYPTVAVDSIVAQLNVDMIGRNRDDKPSESNTVYLVGSDRISTELHDISRAANGDLSKPLTLDYEFNDPADPEQLYFRSDHYSYASKGIPIIFFTTGLHPDYHANTDEVSKIEFEKMTRVAELVYETGARIANLDHAPVTDNKGPRAVKSTP
jgi:hypothetical protein